MPSKFDFVELYKKNKQNKVMIWRGYIRLYDTAKKMFISSVPSKFTSTIIAIVYSEHGQEDGKIQIDEKKVTKGKNIGKANETNVYTQAQIKLNHSVDVKTTAGYVENRDNIDDEIVLPMLAQKFNDAKHKIKFDEGAVVQPKLNGVRCIARIDEKGEVELLSRKGKPYYNLTNIERDIIKLKTTPLLNTSRKYLDGEIYSSEVPFAIIAGACRRQLEGNITEDEQEIINMMEYHAFDTFDLDNLDEMFITRYERLYKTLTDPKTNGESKYKYIKLVETEDVNSEKEVIEKTKEYVSEGYEGIMIRNLDGVYGLDKRSADLQKLKLHMDDEYEVVDIVSGTGRDEDTAIFVLKTKDNSIFKVRPSGSIAYRRKILHNKPKYIGKMITVKFFDYTTDEDGNKTQIPFHATTDGIIRDYE